MVNRFWEIDLLRGTAVVMMILFHLAFDLDFFGVFDLSLNSGFLWFFARATAFIFVFIAGISLTLSYSRSRGAIAGDLRLKFLRMAMKILSWSLLISLTTWIFLREGFIIFGVLHLIGVSIILAYPLLSYRYLNLFLGLSVITLGIYLSHLSFEFPWLLWLGLRPHGLYTFDYFPLFPWFGVFLVGLFFGNSLYPSHQRSFMVPDLTYVPIIKTLSLLGRHSLFIYFVHQPVLILLLYLLGIDVTNSLAYL
jgi:uncharacterized membrane protein